MGKAGPYIELVAALALMVVAVFLATGFFVLATETRGSVAGGVAGVVGCVALFVGSTRWLVHIEHRLRARTDTAAHAFAVAERERKVARWTGRRRGRYSPVTRFLVWMAADAACIFFVVLAVVSANEASKSSYVQHHGVSELALVEYVHNSKWCGRVSCSWSAAITVRLPSPVDGATTSVVHYPSRSGAVQGQRLPVLVDPSQPGYAELPGVPFHRNWQWILAAALAAFMALVAVTDALAFVRLQAFRRPRGVADVAETVSLP